MAEEIPKDAPKIIRLLNLKMSVQSIYFIKTRQVIATAGYVKESDLWCAAIIHFETHKIITNTKPAFKTKKQALAFGEELIAVARETKIS